MKINQLNIWKELWCVINGHDFSEKYTQSEGNFILEEHYTCGNCGLTVKDESGLIQQAKQKYGIGL